MKKSLITQFAMMMFMAFTLSSTLTSCGEEVDINGGGNPGKTVFSAGTSSFNNEDGTRTTLDKNLVYYWQFNDQIWVNEGGTWLKSSDSELSPDGKSARFYYNKLMTGDSYEIVYTGINSTSATQVRIPASFSTNSPHEIYIGLRGDCGVATATKKDGIYQFALQHKGSYLGIAPLKVGYLNKTYLWKKIEITDVNGKPISGTFGFSHANGIDTTSITSPSNTITVTTAANLAGLVLQSYNSEYNYTFVVIPPCHRELYVKYYFINSAEPENVMTITKKLNPRKFLENNVVTFRHGLAPEYYRWDAPKSEPFSPGFDNRNTAADLAQATNSCATMPNPNEMAWYVQNGDPRWDNTTEWTIDDGASTHKGGVWIKKKAYITGFSSTADPNGRDLRTEYRNNINSSSSYVSSGKPANTSQYFFLPALGMCQAGGGGFPENMGVIGYYWSSYAGTFSSTLDDQTGYVLNFDSNQIVLGTFRRGHGCIAGNGSDWFK